MQTILFTFYMIILNDKISFSSTSNLANIAPQLIFLFNDLINIKINRVFLNRVFLNHHTSNRIIAVNSNMQQFKHVTVKFIFFL